MATIMAASYYPTEDPFLNASRGLIRGGEVRNIFGKALGTASVVTTEYRTPWELASDYVFPDSEKTMQIVSSSTSDTAVSVLINGLNSDFEEVSATVTTSGTTPVTITGQNFFRINDAIVISGNAVGDLTISSGGVTYAKILAGTARNQASVFTVPAGKCFYLYRIDAFATDSNGGKAAFFRNYVSNNNSGVVFRVAETQFFNNMSIQRRFPFKYDQKSDVKLQLKSSSGSIDGSVFAEGLLLAEPLGG
jgi:hypothetical protein